jgi:hypothetical protein
MDVIEETIDLLFEFYAMSALSISFPELAVPTVLQVLRVDLPSATMCVGSRMIF